MGWVGDVWGVCGRGVRVVGGVWRVSGGVWSEWGGKWGVRWTVGGRW